jgi:hypothetical protein
MTPTPGNCTTIQQIKNMVERGEKITVKTRDVLLFGAIIDLYESQEEIKSQVATFLPALQFYKWARWATVLICGTLLTLIASGKVEIIFK